MKNITNWIIISEGEKKTSKYIIKDLTTTFLFFSFFLPRKIIENTWLVHRCAFDELIPDYSYISYFNNYVTYNISFY